MKCIVINLIEIFLTLKLFKLQNKVLMETDQTKKFKFVKTESLEQEKLVIALLLPSKDMRIADPNEMISELEFLFDSSFRRGSWGDFHECYQEYKLKNCPLSVLLILTNNHELLIPFLKKNEVNIFKGEFAQFFSTFEGKDSNSVTRHTFQDFLLGHLLIEKDVQGEVELKKLETQEKCGEFQVQHKSAQFSSHSEEKYKQGYFDSIKNGNFQEMKELDKRIYNRAHNIVEKKFKK